MLVCIGFLLLFGLKILGFMVGLNLLIKLLTFCEGFAGIWTGKTDPMSLETVAAPT